MREVNQIILAGFILITLAVLPGLIDGWELLHSMVLMFLIGSVAFVLERRWEQRQWWLNEWGGQGRLFDLAKFANEPTDGSGTGGQHGRDAIDHVDGQNFGDGSGEGDGHGR